MIHKAKDLSPEQKVAIESLLGRHVLDDEAISVRTVEPPTLSDQQKHELAEDLRKYFAEVDARRHPGSAEEAENILTEAIRSSRPLPSASVSTTPSSFAAMSTRTVLAASC